MWSSGVGMWTDTSLPVLVDPSPYPVWAEWGAEIRDLYFIDAEGNHYTHYNITMTQDTPEATEEVVMNQIQNTINNMLFGLNIESEPLEYSMLHAYPNPFNPIINIAFSMDVGSYPNMTIFDLKGTPIEIFPTAYYNPGSYVLQWDASNYASGVYFVKMHAGNYISTEKLMLVK